MYSLHITSNNVYNMTISNIIDTLKLDHNSEHRTNIHIVISETNETNNLNTSEHNKEGISE